MPTLEDLQRTEDEIMNGKNRRPRKHLYAAGTYDFRELFFCDDLKLNDDGIGPNKHLFVHVERLRPDTGVEAEWDNDYFGAVPRQPAHEAICAGNTDGRSTSIRVVEWASTDGVALVISYDRIGEAWLAVVDINTVPNGTDIHTYTAKRREVQHGA